MDITLIHPHSSFLLNETTFPPLGILYLSAALKLTHNNVQCVDLALGHTLSNIQSKVIGISFTSSQKEEAFRIATLLKDNHILIAGGAHPTHMPRECLGYFDYVIRGEADYQLPALVSQLEKGSEKDRILTNLEPHNIDLLPFPDRDALPIHSYHYLINGEAATTVMTSRSCPFSCSYCGKISNKYRAQSAYRTVNEIRHINERYGLKAFMLFDDTFTMDKKRLKEIIWLLKGKNFIFRCFSRSNLLTQEVCELLKEMNVVEVGVGIESGSDEILSLNMKGTTREQNHIAVHNLRCAGIRTKAFIIVGLPGETHETVKETISWIETAMPDDVDFSVFQPMPGSDVYKNPDKYEVQIDYNLTGMFYKGTTGKYHGTSSTKSLTADQIVKYRDDMEQKYKKKELLR